MASGFFAIFDDVATLLDDVVTMSKVAGKKTAGILGDDLAVNAEKATGFAASREIPVLWAITKGSFINKVIILPVVFLLNFFAPRAIIPILLLGGIYLAYEGMEKVFEYLFERPQEEKKELRAAASEAEILDYEAGKIRSAITTDFILSIEIVIIALGTVLKYPLAVQMGVVTFIALLATVGVYGLVALIVRMDDAGLYMIARSSSRYRLRARIGQFLVNALPKVIRSLSLIGTLALLLVAGGIYTHNIPPIHDSLAFMPAILAQLVTGVVVGSLAVASMVVGQKLWTLTRPAG